MFKPGDIVEGLGRGDDQGDYNYTGKGSLCKVLSVNLEGMRVKVLKASPIEALADVYENSFMVSQDYFKLSEGKHMPENKTQEALEILKNALDSSAENIKAVVEQMLQEKKSDIEIMIQDKIKLLTESDNFLTPEKSERLVKKYLNQQRVKTLVIKQDNRETKKLDLAHEDLPTLLKMINVRGASGNRINVYMHGPAGSGKSMAAHQVADILGLRFGYASLNPMTPDSRVLGFMHAGGDYVGTEFFKCYTEGGVFCFDEIDNASASFVTTLNSALENGHGAFPHGVYKRHPDFVCVCTANTIGRGGNIHYPERRALDSAFLERFVFIEWNYDDKLTKAIVGTILGDKSLELIEWVDNKAVDYRARFPELVISPRAYIQSALLEAHGFDRKTIEAATLSRGLKNA